ncbi:MAG: OmpA family protein [Flavobacteriales bacterium]|nr:OmpA family protein [Flavobacteriales bacterium]
MSRKGAVGVILLLVVQLGFSQVKKADKYFASLQYEEAIPLYLKAMKKGNDSAAVINLAESYRLIQDYKSAEVYYKRASELYPKNADVQLKYGQMLKSNSKLNEAKEVFVVYANRNPSDASGKNYVLSCDRVRSWSVQTPGFEVKNEEGLNSENSDFSPMPFGNGVAFVSDRFGDNSDATGPAPVGFLSITFAEMNEDSTFKKAKPISNIINNEFHNGPICFNKDQSEAYFTRVDYDRKKGKDFVNKPQIYVSKLNGNKWGKPEPFQHNDENYAFSQPALSPDGSMLYFASDMKGTKGKLDLFFCKREGSSWSSPINLGNEINTSGSEMFPTITADALYFSSNGLVGIGGLDIFKSKLINGKWSKPENLKDPINSPRDDFGLVFSDDKNGFFSSNREGGKGGDDIYRFKLTSKTGTETEISGIFLYSELDPATNSLIQLLDEDGNMIMETTTDADGAFTFSGLESDKNYQFKVSSDDPKLTDFSQIFLTNEQGEKVVALAQPTMGEFHFRALEPEKMQELQPIEEEDIQLTFVNIFGQLYDKIQGDYQEGMEVLLVNDDGKIVYSTVTNEQGRFTFPNQLSNQDYRIRLASDTLNVNVIFTNAQGKKTGTAQKVDGQHYIFLSKNVYVSTESELFGKIFRELPEDYTSSIQVYLIDDDGVVVARVNSDKKGEFSFKQLEEHKHYKIRLENDPDLQIIFTDRQGGKLANARKIDDKHFIFLTKDLSDPETSSVFGKIYQELPGDYTGGMEVYLINDDGEIIYTTVSDANGEFNFENLPADQHYAIKLKELDSEYKILMLDEVGDPTEALKQTADGDFQYQTVESEDNSLFGKVYETLPGDYSVGMEIYLVDEDGQIVYTTHLDKDGNFNFENLPADQNFVVRLQQTGDDLNMIVLNDLGEVESKAKQTSEGDFEYERVKGSDKTGLFGNIFKELPGDFSGGLEVYLVDDEGNIVYTTITDEDGNFNFENLPVDHNYKIKLKDVEDDFQMVVLGESGEMKRVIETENGYILEKEPKRQLLGNVYQTLPGDYRAGVEVYLLDDDGNIVYQTKTDANGNFAFKNLPADRHFVIQLKDAPDDINMVALNDKGEIQSSIKQNVKGNFDPQPIQDENESIFGQAYQELPGDFSVGMEVYLVDDNGNIVYTTTTDENGDFVFENLPADKHYVIKFNEEDTQMKVLFMDDEGEQIGSATAETSGDFEYSYISSKKEYISLLTSNDVVIKIIEDPNFIVFTINFGYDNSLVQTEDKEELNKLSELMRRNPHISVKITAFADSKGPKEYNNRLTLHRATQAKTYLVSRGISQDRIIAKGYGEERPVAPNAMPNGSDNPIGRAKNRRAEIQIIRN